eukprot:7372146-Heterocapsa_arctica.AAC.1
MKMWIMKDEGHAWRTMMINMTKVERTNVNYLIQEGLRRRLMTNTGLPPPAMIERYATPQPRPTRHRGERQGVVG